MTAKDYVDKLRQDGMRTLSGTELRVSRRIVRLWLENKTGKLVKMPEMIKILSFQAFCKWYLFTEMVR